MAPPQKFSRAALQAAALALVDEGGLSALSMRSLARQLGTGAMTLYGYVRGRDELDALVVEGVMAAAALPEADANESWQAAVRAIAESAWAAVSAHPHAIPLILTSRIRHEASLAFSEQLLTALARSEREGAALLDAFRVVTGFVIGLAQAQLQSVRGVAHAHAPDPAIDEVLALPPDRFPRLREIADAATRSSPRQQFHAGMDIILAGLTRTPG